MDYGTIVFSTVQQLEEATRGIGPGDAVVFKFVGSCTLNEAAIMFRQLECKIALTNGRWMLYDDSMKILSSSTEYYSALDTLELVLDLMDRDLQASVPMNKGRFDDVRMTANELATTAHASDVLGLFDDVIIESQRLGRVCRGLGFGREEIEVPSLTQEDLDWLMAEGVAALVLAGDGGEVLADDYSGSEVLQDGAGLVDGAVVLAGGGEKVLPDLVDRAEALAGGGEKVLPDLVDRAEALAGGGEKVLPVLVDGAEELGGSVEGVDIAEALAGTVDIGKPLADQSQGGWVQVKERTVMALLRLKICKLMEAIVAAKGRTINA